MTRIVSVSSRHEGLYLPVSCMTDIFRIRHQQQGQMDYMAETFLNNGAFMKAPRLQNIILLTEQWFTGDAQAGGRLAFLLTSGHRAIQSL